MRHPRETGYDHAEGYPACAQNSWGVGWSRLNFLALFVVSFSPLSRYPFFPGVRVGLQSREAPERKLVELISFVRFFSLIYLVGEANLDPFFAISRHTGALLLFVHGFLRRRVLRSRFETACLFLKGC